jgi:hypothetical protein
MEEMPFLSLDPGYAPNSAPDGALAPGSAAGREPEEIPPAPGGIRRDQEATSPLAESGAEPFAEDDIVELTAEEMLDSPLLREMPDVPRGPDTALDDASPALGDKDA